MSASQKIPVSGPMLQQKHLEFLKELAVNDFKASNGWLEKFRQKQSISFKAISGEAVAVDSNAVNEWVKYLPLLLAYSTHLNIFSADETGLLFRALPEKTSSLKATCVGGKVSKERLTILLLRHKRRKIDTITNR